jgi:hypothetical protein
MLTRRDLATFTWYGVVFSAVVFWAMRRRGEESDPGAGSAPLIGSASETLDRSEGNAELR